MNLYLIAIGIGFAIALFFGLANITEPEYKGEPIKNKLKVISIWFLVGGVILSLLLSGELLLLDSMPIYKDATTTTNTSIYSLHTGDKLSGSFFLGIGSINSNTQYVFYQDSGTGGAVLRKIPTEGTIIYQDENEKPYLKSIRGYQYDTKTGKENTAYWDTLRYEFHVPSGTIMEEYKL